MRNSLSILLFTFWLIGCAGKSLASSCYFITSTDSLADKSVSFTIDSEANPDLYFPKDTVAVVKDTSSLHSWKRATIWSACLPGAGQIYNEFGYRRVQNKKHRAWWKAPIIYGALGTTGYYFYQNLATARALKTEWIFRQENTGQLLYPEYYDWADDDLLKGKFVPKVDANGNQLYDVEGNPLFTEMPGFDLAAKRRDMLGFGFMAIWGLQVVEALVDGHFVTFDISEDLSFNWSPVMLNAYTPGVYLRLELN